MQRARPTAVVHRVLPNAISAVPIDRTRVARRTRLRRRRERERQRPVTGRKTLLADYVAIVPHAYCTVDRPPRTTRPGRSSRGTSFRCIPERTEAPDARSREASPATRHRKDTLPPLQVTSPPETYRTGYRRFRSSIRHCCRYACGCRDNPTSRESSPRSLQPSRAIPRTTRTRHCLRLRAPLLPHSSWRSPLPTCHPANTVSECNQRGRLRMSCTQPRQRSSAASHRPQDRNAGLTVILVSQAYRTKTRRQIPTFHPRDTCGCAFR